MKMKTMIAIAVAALLSSTAAFAAPVKKTTPKTDFEKAVEHFNNDETDAALELFQKVVAEKPDNGYAWAYITSIKLSDKDIDGAYEAGMKAEPCLPTADTAFCAWFYSECGAIYAAKKDYSQAIDIMSSAIEMQPQDAFYYMRRGKYEQRVDKLEEAEADYRKAIALDAKNESAHMGLGTILNSKEQYDDAIGAFTEAIKLNPDNADAYAYRAISLYNTNRNDEAIADVATAYEKDDDGKNSHCEFVLPYLMQYDSNKVIKAIEAKRDADSGNAEKWQKVLSRLNGASALGAH